MDLKHQLLKQTQDAFADGGMSLKSSIKGLAPEQASWRLNDAVASIAVACLG